MVELKGARVTLDAVTEAEMETMVTKTFQLSTNIPETTSMAAREILEEVILEEVALEEVAMEEEEEMDTTLDAETRILGEMEEDGTRGMVDVVMAGVVEVVMAGVAEDLIRIIALQMKTPLCHFEILQDLQE